jgi:Fanconi anemia group M protein
MANDTRDEAYFWISRRKEKQMTSELRKLKGVAEEVEAELDDSQSALDQFDDAADASGSNAAGGDAATENGEGTASAATGREDRAQPGLVDFGVVEAPADSDTDGDDAETVDTDAHDTDDGSDVANAHDVADDSHESTDDRGDDAVVASAGTESEGVEIVADQRELDSTIARDLSTREGITTRLETLAVGDYVLSDRVAVERKSVSDFLDTLTGGERSMFEQVGDLVGNYSRPIVVIEGDDLYGARNIHPNAIRGAVASLAVDFNASVLRTDDEGDTADLLETIARREQEVRDRAVSVHGEKSAKTLAEQQEYVVAAIADIGPVTARALLEHFGSVEAVMIAPKDDLLAVRGVGEVTADRIREVVGSDYA